jgi:acyl dehydratase
MTKITYWEDIEIGQKFVAKPISVDAREIRKFALQFDPQPYHLDRSAAEESLFGGLCASGWHVCALTEKMLNSILEQEGIVILGSNKVPWLRWEKPVFESDKITAHIEIEGKVNPQHSASFGQILCQIVVENQENNRVLELSNSLMVKARDAK